MKFLVKLVVAVLLQFAVSSCDFRENGSGRTWQKFVDLGKRSVQFSVENKTNRDFVALYFLASNISYQKDGWFDKTVLNSAICVNVKIDEDGTKTIKDDRIKGEDTYYTVIAVNDEDRCYAKPNCSIKDGDKIIFVNNNFVSKGVWDSIGETFTW